MINTNIYNFPTDLDDETFMLPEPDPELLLAYGKVNYWWNEAFKYEKLNNFDKWKFAIKEWQSSQKALTQISKKHGHDRYYDLKERTCNMETKASD